MVSLNDVLDIVRYFCNFQGFIRQSSYPCLLNILFGDGLRIQIVTTPIHPMRLATKGITLHITTSLQKKKNLKQTLQQTAWLALYIKTNPPFKKDAHVQQWPIKTVNDGDDDSLNEEQRKIRFTPFFYEVQVPNWSPQM